MQVGRAVPANELGDRIEIEGAEADHVRALERDALVGPPRGDDQQPPAAMHGVAQPLDRARRREVHVLDHDHDRPLTARTLNRSEEIREEQRLAHRGIGDRRRLRARQPFSRDRTEQWRQR